MIKAEKHVNLGRVLCILEVASWSSFGGRTIGGNVRTVDVLII